MKRRNFARAGRMLAVGALVAAGVGAATPASAATLTVQTGGWDWVEVHDTALGISDATAFHRDVLGSGVVLKGWTEDAFDAYLGVDGYLSSLGFEHQNPGLSALLAPVPESFVVHPDGGATVVSRVEDFDLGGGALLDVTVTLDIAGSFARWTIQVDDGGSGLVESVVGSGELGSPTTIAPVGGSGLVVSGPPGRGPVIGLHVESDGTSDVLDGSDPEFPGFESVGATTIVFTLALLEYDPCAEAEAVAAMTTLVPQFPVRFGDDLAPVSSTTCLTVEAPAPMQIGDPVDEVLELELHDALAGGHPRLDGETYFDYVDLWTSGLSVLAPGLPAGLSAEIVEDPVTLLPALRVSGVPIEAMSGEVDLMFYGIRNDPGFAGELPVAATLRLDVDALDIADPGDSGDPPAGQLAAAGYDATPLLVLAGALICAGTVLAVVVRARRGRPSTRSHASRRTIPE
jgi:hypothetical protein